MTLTKPRYGDGAMAGKDFVIEFLSHQITNRQLREEVRRVAGQRDGAVRDANNARIEKKASEEQLRQIALCADTIIDALRTQRAAIEAVAPNGGWTIEQVKAVELAARVISEAKAHYGKGNGR